MTDFSFLYNRYLRNQRIVNGYRYQYSHPVGGMVSEPYFQDAILREQDCFVDVGANVGGWCIPASKYYKRVIAFEANPEIVNVLHKNIRLNNITNVEILPFALGTTTGEKDLYLYQLNGQDSFLEEHMGFRSWGPRVKAKIVALDSYGYKPSLIKIDTEGYEVQVLLGAMKTIHEYSPCLCIETHKTGDPDLISQLLPGYNWTLHKAETGQVSMVGKS
jgi:FkbM family methyltransferase